jgi:cytochrome c553
MRDGGVPRIAGQHISVLAKQLADYRHDRRWDIRMEHFADRHHLVDAQAIADVTAYIHQLLVDALPGVVRRDLLPGLHLFQVHDHAYQLSQG